MKRAILYLLTITVAEAIVVVLDPVTGLVAASIIGIACHIVILFAVIIDAALINSYYNERFVLSLSIIPLIRVISLSLPLADIPLMWQYPIIYIPLLAAVIVLANILDLKPGKIGVRFGFIPLQLVVALTGLGFGVVEYLILRPEPMVTELTLQAVWLPALVLLLATGFVEEFIFRGVLQRTVTEVFGGWGIVYVSYLFAILHIGWIQAESQFAVYDVAFVFVVALFFGWVVKKTGSLFGVTLSHGLTNIILFIVAPFYF
ncbi:lysostaphin resistance A-like protein [Chloroflexota bacterium]